MRSRVGRLAWALWAFGICMLVGAGVLGVLAGLREGEGIFVLLLPLLVLAFLTIGALIAARHPGNGIGWVFVATGLLWSVSSLATSVAEYAANGGIAVSEWVRLADWLGSWVFIPGIYVPVTFLLLLFPDGRLPSPRWRFVAWAAAITISLLTVGSALRPGPIEDAVILRTNPYGVGSVDFWDTVGGVAWMLAFAGVLASVGALFLRLRRSSGEEHQQIKWLAYASAIIALIYMLTGIGWAVFGDDRTVSTIVLPAIILTGLLLVPLAAGIAILRHRLYDLDVVINKTVIYGGLAAFVTAAYVGIVIGIGALVGRRGNVFLSIVATAIIAVAFQPARERARRLANRLVYGRRATPYEVLSEFSDRVAGSYATEDVLPRMARIVGEGTGAARASVWLRVGHELRPEAGWPPEELASTPIPLSDGEVPELPGVDRAYPVRDQGQLLGALAVAKPKGEALTPAEEKLLADLASQAGLVLRNVRLTEELKANLEELRASRQRIVTAQDEERRRIERNIHDGAQQQLVALAVRLRLAETLTERDPERAKGLLGQLKAETQEALENLRDLARGIYPPLLADKGLLAALEAQARKSPVEVVVEADGLVRYPQDVEAAVYFCCLEALQNISKYANASKAVVRLAAEEGRLVFSVSDDGTGFDNETQPRGSGLQNMADRMEALGGSLKVESALGMGTTVTGRVPVASSGSTP